MRLPVRHSESTDTRMRALAGRARDDAPDRRLAPARTTLLSAASFDEAQGRPAQTTIEAAVAAGTER